MPERAWQLAAPAGRRATLTGWGQIAPTVSEVIEPAGPAHVAGRLRQLPYEGVIARGLGRSYNNAAQNEGGRVIVTTRMNQISELDIGDAVVAGEAGGGLDEL